MEVLDALEREAARTGTFVAGLAEGDWSLDTRCPPMTILDLAAHTLRGASRLSELIAAPYSEAEPEKDAVTYFRYDPVEVGPGVVRRAQKDASSRTGPGLAEEWGRAWRSAVTAARERLADDPVLVSPFGTIRLREYVRTRCVEVTIHSMDLRDALGLDPDPTPEALTATGDVLRGLLGADLRPSGFDEVRFALVGTGRAALDDAERERLGPLADLFPLLS